LPQFLHAWRDSFGQTKETIHLKGVLNGRH
jgi:hypothetical protein